MDAGNRQQSGRGKSATSLLSLYMQAYGGEIAMPVRKILVLARRVMPDTGQLVRLQLGSTIQRGVCWGRGVPLESGMADAD